MRITPVSGRSGGRLAKRSGPRTPTSASTSPRAAAANGRRPNSGTCKPSAWPRLLNTSASARPETGHGSRRRQRRQPTASLRERRRRRILPLPLPEHVNRRVSESKANFAGKIVLLSAVQKSWRLWRRREQVAWRRIMRGMRRWTPGFRTSNFAMRKGGEGRSRSGMPTLRASAAWKKRAVRRSKAWHAIAGRSPTRPICCARRLIRHLPPTSWQGSVNSSRKSLRTRQVHHVLFAFPVHRALLAWLKASAVLPLQAADDPRAQAPLCVHRSGLH
mmetsp:Transcript_115804/g.338676  ORF Transcript_115804/g.338676 Transcript_115804/m.338676 type:complete len:275 (-) Transcript_115804:426-1250(-)